MAIKYFIIKMCRYDFMKVIPSKYFINNIQIENVTLYKYLGIIFENNLLFNKHIYYICKKSLFFFEFNC